MPRKIAHITDLHLEEKPLIEFEVRAKENWETILNSVKENGINDVIFTGDIGTHESNRWFFNSVKDQKLNFKIILGNHDLLSEAKKYYDFDFPDDRKELYYSEEDEYAKYLFLDSSSGQIDSVQLGWLRKELQCNKRILLFIHHPILDTGTTPQREFPLKGSEKIKNALLEYTNEIYIFCGHLHLDDVQKEKNLTQWVTPAASYPLKKYSETTERDNLSFGYRIIEIEKDSINTKTVMFDPTTAYL